MSSQHGVVIDAALRFARSNPELVRYAHDNAGVAGTSVDDLLNQAIDRVVAKRASMRPTCATPFGGQPLLRAL
jgi:hypothetical protein